MKLFIVLLAAVGMGGGPSTQTAETCAAPAAAAASSAAPHGAHSSVPASCDHAINTKGTGTSGRAAAPACGHAINTKGTGAAGKTVAPPRADTAGTNTGSTAKYSAPVNITGNHAVHGGSQTEGEAVASSQPARCDKIRFKQEFGPSQATKKN